MPRNIEIKARIEGVEALMRAPGLADAPRIPGAYLDLLSASAAGSASARKS